MGPENLDQDLENNGEDNLDNNLNKKSEIKDSSIQELIKQIENLREKLDLSEKKNKESQDKVLYTLAELENIKRRAQIDIEHAHKFSLEKCLNQLIPVIDSLDQALENINKDKNNALTSPIISPLSQGIEMTLSMFINTLSKFGVVRIDPKDQLFNPELHEAMSMQPMDGVPSNTVTMVYQRGYQLNGRLVRPARVIVAS